MSISLINPDRILLKKTIETEPSTDNVKLKANMEFAHRLIAKNLTTNDPRILFLNYEITSLPKTSLQEKASLLLLHFRNKAALYKEAFLSTAILVGACAFMILLTKSSRSNLAKLRSDIMAGRLVYKHSYQRVGMEHFYSTAFSQRFMVFITNLSLLTSISLLNVPTILSLKSSMQDFYTNAYETKVFAKLRWLSAKTENLANNLDEQGNIEDPFSGDFIPSDWKNAPRFIQVGSYLFSLDSLLKQIFQKPLQENQVRHPVETARYLNPKELSQLIDNLCQLFLIEKEHFLKFFDPYFCDRRKIPLYNDPRVNTISNETEKQEALQDILFEIDLSKMVPDWSSLDRSNQVSIKQQIRNEYFASLRLRNFLRRLPEEVLSLDIPINENHSIRLQDMLDEEKRRAIEYSYDIVVTVSSDPDGEASETDYWGSSDNLPDR